MEPVIVEFEVAASTSHAFEVWTARSSIWWPRSHTASKDPDVTIVFEPFVGERVYERASDGVEHDWGRSSSGIRLAVCATCGTLPFRGRRRRRSS